MRSSIKIISSIGILLIASTILLACSSPGSGSKSAAPESYNFKVTNLSVDPAEVNSGVQLLITARVTNIGSNTENYQGNIKIDNTGQAALPVILASSVIKIPAGGTQLVSVVTTVKNPGSYQVTWDKESRPFKVNPEDTSVPGGSRPISDAVAPQFSGVDVVTGKTVSLDQHTGSVIILNFVNYGCNPSTNQVVGAQLLALKQLQNQRGDFVPFSIFCGCCPPDVLKQFATDNGLTWPWILDTDYSIADKYAKYITEYGYPTLVFIDKDMLINSVTGYTSLDGLDTKVSQLAGSNVK